MKLGACPLSARRLWFIKGDQQSMSWLVFSSLLWKKCPSTDATFQLCLLSSPQLAFRRLAVVQHSAQKCDLRSTSIKLEATQNVSFISPAHRSFLTVNHKHVNIGLILASGFCLKWPLPVLFPPLLHFPSPDQLHLWVS